MKRPYWITITALILCMLLLPFDSLRAEDDENPFGADGAPQPGQIPPPPPPGVGDNDDPGEDNDIGLDIAPEDLPDPIPVSPNAPTISPEPTIPPPSNPRPSRLRPSESAQPSSPTPTMPSQANGNGKKPAAPKLDEYLQLETSASGLQVKNFDIKDQDIQVVVKLISTWTGKNFILDSKVRGKITILGPSEVSLDEAYQAFLSALSANNLTTVQQGKFIRIIESGEARRSPVKTYTGDYAPNDEQYITRIIQLNYINADEIQREFRDMVTRQGKLFAYEPTNSIIITDTGSNIQRIKELLQSLDVKSFETSLHVIPIQNGSAKKISDLLAEIYGGAGGGGGSAARRTTFRRSELERQRGGGVITKILPDEQTNSLVVLANAAGVRKLKQLVAQLDIKTDESGRIHVYYCEYAKAEDLAETLAALAQGGGSGGGSSQRGPSARARSRSTPQRPSATPGGDGGGGPSIPGRSGPISADLGEGVKVTADPSTNALVITANSADYQTIRRVIKKLDIPRLQVFVETAILEISVDDSTDWKLNLATGGPHRLFHGGFIGDLDGLKNFLTGSPGSGLTVPGFYPDPSFSHNIPGVGTVKTSTFMGLINLIAQNTESQVLSTPQIIALDNEEASFKVQDKIPFISSVVNVANSQNTQQSREIAEVGIDIKLTPHVNAASRTIRLEIEQTVDNIKKSNDVPKDLQNTNFATTSRVTNTTVVVKDQNYVMLGGLMADSIAESETKVPLLGDIPILGWLFKSKNYRKQKSNLVILLKPTIIGTTLAAAELLQDRMNKRDKFLEDNMSGDDAFEERTGEIKEGITKQQERGKTEKEFDYQNLQDEDEIPEPKPGEESQLLKEGEVPKEESERITENSSETKSSDDAAPLLPGPEQNP